jgi:deoxyribonuclease (pyrimidine dimer)
MTRINLVPPRKLTDQHLIAEIKEINQLAGQFRKSLESKLGIRDIPEKFCLGKGHVKFFYNKGSFLRRRYHDLYFESILRGFDVKATFSDAWAGLPQYDNDWIPTEVDIALSQERIDSKLLLKPGFYRYYGSKIKEAA